MIPNNTDLRGFPTGESNDHPLLGGLAVLVGILHLLLLMRLLDPNDQNKISKPPKVVEVVLLKPEPIVPKEKAAPAPPSPAPAKPVAPKVVTPKKSPPKPKPVEKPKPAVSKEPAPKKVKKVPENNIEPKTDDRPPVLTSPFAPSAKSDLTSTARPSTKPNTKPGNGDAAGKGGNSGVVAISRVKPSYPARAASRHIEGWVKVEFTVTATGAVTNPSVVSGSPPGIFDEAGLAAIRQWRFKPKMVNGVPTAQRAVQTLKFTLSN